MVDPNCPRCAGEGWVCEAHPERPWGGKVACFCGAPGDPCPVCNAAAADVLGKAVTEAGVALAEYAQGTVSAKAAVERVTSLLDNEVVVTALSGLRKRQ